MKIAITLGFLSGALLLAPYGTFAQEPAPAPAPAEEKAKPAAAPEKSAAVSIQQDRIKSVQRKDFLKRGRFELTPVFALSLNDAFYQKLGGGAQFTYHPADSLGLEINFLYTATIQTDMGKFFQQAMTALPKVSQLRWVLTGDITWSPIYGKLSLFTDDIVMFDAYLIGGFGVAYTEKGARLATDVGLGLRYFATSWMVFKLEVRDVLYTETLSLDSGARFTDIQNHLLLMAAVSFFLPVEFEYEFQ